MAVFVLFWVVLLGLALVARNLDPLPSEPPPPLTAPPNNAWNDYSAAMSEVTGARAVQQAMSSNLDEYGATSDLGKLRRSVGQLSALLDFVQRSESKPLAIEQRLPSYALEGEVATTGREQVRLNPHQQVQQYQIVSNALVLRGDLARADGRYQAALDDYKAALRYTARLKSSGGLAPYIGACLAESVVLRRLAGLVPSLDAKQLANVQEVMGKSFAASQIQWAWERETTIGESWLYALLRDDRGWRDTLIQRARTLDPTFKTDDKTLRRSEFMVAYRQTVSYGYAAVVSLPAGPVVDVPALVRAAMPPYRDEDDQIAKANRAEMVLMTAALAAKRYRAATGADPKRIADLRSHLPKLFPVELLDPFSEGRTMLRMASDADGAVSLWSVGANIADDDGAVWRTVGKPPRMAERYDPSRGDVTIRLLRDGRIEFAGRFARPAPAPNSGKVGPRP